MTEKKETELTERTREEISIQQESNIYIKKPKGKNRYMPADFSISLGNKGGTDQQLLNPGTARNHNMRGFEDIYVDIVDYIVRITHKIWEEKD